jgi:hypothetical protein
VPILRDHRSGAFIWEWSGETIGLSPRSQLWTTCCVLYPEVATGMTLGYIADCQECFDHRARRRRYGGCTYFHKASELLLAPVGQLFHVDIVLLAARIRCWWQDVSSGSRPLLEGYPDRCDVLV